MIFRWPGVAVFRLLAEIRELGYTGSPNLLVRYLDQGSVETECVAPPARRLVGRSVKPGSACPRYSDSALISERCAAGQQLVVLEPGHDDGPVPRLEREKPGRLRLTA